MTTRELSEKFTREEGIALYNSKKTDKEVYDLLVSKGLTDSYETFISETQKIFNEKFSQMSKEEILKQIEGAELTDEQLEQIAGGEKTAEEKKENEIIACAGFGSVVVIGISAAAGAYGAF